MYPSALTGPHWPSLALTGPHWPSLALTGPRWLAGIVKYDAGQFYNTHHDYADGDGDRPASGRLLTLLIYLSEPDAAADGGDSGDGGGGSGFNPRNGATYFPALNISVPPTKYSALLWSNVATLPSTDTSTDHPTDPSNSHIPEVRSTSLPSPPNTHTHACVRARPRTTPSPWAWSWP